MKLKLCIMEKILNVATAKEIDFIVYTLRYQDKFGIVQGIDYKDTCKEIGIHKSKFYKILNDLEEKGIIHILWFCKKQGFWGYQIIDNSFENNEDYKKGYVNLNTAFLYDKAFYKATKAEKIICLKILSLFRVGRKAIPLKIETLMRWTGATHQSVEKFINTIRNIFNNVTLRGNLITLDFSQFATAFRRMVDETDFYNEHIVEYISAVKKIKPSIAEIKDTAYLFKLFEKKYGRATIITAIIICIDNNKALIAKYVNRMIGIVHANGIPFMAI